MKHYLISILIGSILSSQVFSTEEDAHFKSLRNYQMEDLIEKSEVFKGCQSSDLSNLNNGSNIKAAVQKTSKCFTDRLKTLTPTQMNELQENLGMKTPETTDGIDRDLAIKYFQERIEKGLYGKQMANRIRNFGAKDIKHIDQKTFLEIYDSLIGRAVIYSIADYCFENEQDKDYFDKPQNIGNYQIKYKSCLKEIKTASCSNIALANSQSNSQSNTQKNPQSSNANQQSMTSNQNQVIASEKSKCLLKAKLRSYKATLSRVKTDIKFFERLRKNPILIVSQNDQSLVYMDGANAGEDKISEITAFSSVEIEESLGEEKTTIQDLTDRITKTCLKQFPVDECEKLINNSDEDTIKSLQVKYEAMIKSYENTLKNYNKDELLELAKKSNRYTEDEMKSFESLDKDKLAADLIAIYRGEKQSHLAALNKLRADSNSYKKDSKLTQTNINEIIQRAKDSRKKLKQVIRFANIGSGDLDVTTKSPQQGQASAGSSTPSKNKSGQKNSQSGQTKKLSALHNKEIEDLKNAEDDATRSFATGLTKVEVNENAAEVDSFIDQIIDN